MSSKPVRVISVLPSEPGVYRFKDRYGAVLYLGRATNLRRRVGSYWSELGDRRHLVAMVRATEQIEAVVCASRHEAAWLERSLLEAELPPWNRTPGGQEVVVHIRLDQREGSAELSVEHDTEAPIAGVRWFGPYLGGAQVRRAVTALRRSFPLHYTAPDAAGTNRAFAQRLGLGASDRDDLAAALTAILERDPEAVASICGVLERARDEAAASQRYELADRAQYELWSLAWVTDPQRLTSADGRDVDVHGWADDILLMLTIRNGCVTRWNQQPMDLADAQPLLEATPVGWRAFANRNAQLAAKLAAR